MFILFDININDHKKEIENNLKTNWIFLKMAAAPN